MASLGGSPSGTIQVSKYFHTSSTKFKQNRSTKGVICLACVAKEARRLHLAQHPDATPRRTVQYFEEQVKAIVPVQSNDNSTLYFKKDVTKQLAHLQTCEEVDAPIRNLAGVDLRMLYGLCINPMNGHLVKYKPASELTHVSTSHPHASALAPAPAPALPPSQATFPPVIDPVLLPPTQGWTKERQQQFAQDMLRLLIAVNASFMSVAHPYWRHFFSVWVPGGIVPTRTEISGSILDKEAERVTDIMKKEVKGCYGTGQSDGWKSEAKEALVGSMVNVEYRPWPLNLFTITGEKKSALNLFNIVLSEIAYCVTTLGILLVAYCTDSGGDAAKMRRMLFAKSPWLIVIACWAHQMNLILGDFFKHNKDLKEFLNLALEVVKWFNNHSVARGILGKWQTRVGMLSVLILILPCATRWTSYFNATKRLLKVEHAIRRAVGDDTTRAELLACAGNKKEAKAQAAKVIRTVQDDSFWAGLHLLLGILKPMALASHATQSDNAHLGVVFGALVRLYWSFSLPRMWKGRDMHEPVRNSIQKRFDNTEYELLVLVILLNPYLRKAPFRNGSPFASFMGCWELFERAYTRIVREQPDSDCRAAFRAYILEEGGAWSAESMGLREARDRATTEEKPVNLIHLWREFDSGSNNGSNGLVRLALILHSAVANSAATERYFSALGTICSKLRTRLLPERMRKTVLVKRQVNVEYPKQKRQKRSAAGAFFNTGDANERDDEEFVANEFMPQHTTPPAQSEREVEQPSNTSPTTTSPSSTTLPPQLDSSTMNALIGAGILNPDAVAQFTSVPPDTSESNTVNPAPTVEGLFDKTALDFEHAAIDAEEAETETAEFMASQSVHRRLPLRYSVQDFSLPNLIDFSGYPDRPSPGLKLILDFFDSGKGSLDGEAEFLESVTQSVTP